MKQSRKDLILPSDPKFKTKREFIVKVKKPESEPELELELEQEHKQELLTENKELEIEKRKELANKIGELIKKVPKSPIDFL